MKCGKMEVEKGRGRGRERERDTSDLRRSTEDGNVKDHRGGKNQRGIYCCRSEGTLYG